MFAQLKKSMLPFIQAFAYLAVNRIGLVFAIITSCMSVSPFFVDEAGRTYVMSHWLISTIVYISTAVTAVALVLLKFELERREWHLK